MSIHPSLSAPDKGSKQKSVLKRTERLRMMMDKGQWKEGDKVFGLPKIKTLRIKIKKEKAEKAATETTAAAGATPAAAGATPAAGTKGQASPKAQEKEKK